MKKYIRYNLILFLSILVCISLISCGEKNGLESNNQKENVYYIATSKDGIEIKYKEGEFIDYEEIEKIIGIVGAFDLQDDVFSYIVDGKKHLANLYGEKIIDKKNGLEAEYRIRGKKVLVEPDSFLRFFDFTIDKFNTKEKSSPQKSSGDSAVNSKKGYTESENTERKRLIMAWDNYANNSSLKFADALDIIIAKNISLKSGNGDCNISLDDSYIANAKSQYKRIWFMATNSFDPKMTKKLLNSYKYRQNYINSVVNYCLEKDLEGVSLDFENMYLEDSDLFVQFVAELHAELYKNNKYLGVCVTVPGGSDMWSKVYDRHRISQNTDYLMLMAYDQHWASSQISGPVASYTWVKNNIEKLSKTTDKSKLILGLPFYTRVWYESYSDKVVNKVKVRSKDLYMKGPKNILKNLQTDDYKRVWDADSSQYFFVYYDNNLKETVKFWFDDADSVARKANLINDYGLAGISCWALGFEDLAVWEKLERVKNKEQLQN